MANGTVHYAEKVGDTQQNEKEIVRLELEIAFYNVYQTCLFLRYRDSFTFLASFCQHMLFSLYIWFFCVFIIPCISFCTLCRAQNKLTLCSVESKKVCSEYDINCILCWFSGSEISIVRNQPFILITPMSTLTQSSSLKIIRDQNDHEQKKIF